MKPVIAAMLLVVLAVVCIGAAQVDAQRDHTMFRFAAMEIWIDTHDRPLAAYQIDFHPNAGDVRIVGIEGAAPESVYADPPYYDPAAMMSERVILADFSTARAGNLPRGAFRLATIHVQIIGDVEPEFTIERIVTANPAGNDIPAVFTIKTGNES